MTAQFLSDVRDIYLIPDDRLYTAGTSNIFDSRVSFRLSDYHEIEARNPIFIQSREESFNQGIQEEEDEDLVQFCLSDVKKKRKGHAIAIHDTDPF